MAKKRKLEEIQNRLLNILQNNSEMQDVVVTLKDKLGLQDRNEAIKLMNALNTMDTNFNLNAWYELKETIKKLKVAVRELKEVKKLPKDAQDQNIYKLAGGEETSGGTAKVLLDTSFKGKHTVVKILKKENKVDVYIESIINIFMCAVLRKNEYISTPDIVTLAVNKKHKDKNNKRDQLLQVQEKLNAVQFNDLTPQQLDGAIIKICKGLTKLQNEYNFAHRDFHYANVLFDDKTKQVFIIDFEYSCFSVPDTKGSIQPISNRFFWQPFNQKAHIACINKSHDICVLLLSLYQKQPKFRSIGWLDSLCRFITKRYIAAYEKIKDTPDFKKNYEEQFWNMDGNVYEDPEFSLDKNLEKSAIIHYWYLYTLFNIDIGLTPFQVRMCVENPTYKIAEVEPLFKLKLKF